MSPPILFCRVCDLPIVSRAISELRVEGLYDRTCSAAINQSNSTFKWWAVPTNKSSSILEITARLYFCLSDVKTATVSGNGCQFLSESSKQFISVPDAVSVG